MLSTQHNKISADSIKRPVTGKLEILMLGPPIVRWNGDLISIQRRLPRALLFYLAWEGSMVARDSIIDMFWEGSPGIARPRLTETISRLRAVLPEEDLLVSYDGLLGLDMERVYSDRGHFEELIDHNGPTPWQIPGDVPLPPEITENLTKANNLWRGNCPLEGLRLSTASLDHWLRQSSEHIQGLRFNVLTRLSDDAFTNMNFQAALDYGRAAQEYDPYNEDIHFKILLNLIKLGHAREARQYFEDTREMMLNELGISPSPRMIRIYKKIRNPEATPLPDIEPRWEIHSSMEVPFVGRRNALCEINQIIARRHAVVILGESGQGKSRLMQEFISQFNPQPRFLLAVCRPMESMLPFHPFIELFRRHVTPDEWLSLSPVWAIHLVGLLPELAQIRDDLNLLSLFRDSDQAQGMIFESIRQVFLLMNEKRSLFLILDDAHWADEASLATVAYLLVRPPFTISASLAILARPEDLTSNLQMMLDSIQQSKHATIFALNQLQREDFRHLAFHILKVQPSEHFLSHLIADSGGNTFFVLEILRAIVDADMDVSSLDISLPLTENLQNLILTRLQKISSKSREVIEIAALIGSEFSLDVLGKASLTPLEDLAIILEELESKLLVLPHMPREGVLFYRFSHDKIRETLLRHIPLARSQILHGRIVQALNKTVQQAAVLAHHYTGAGELKTAFQYWIKAAERALKLFAKEDASHNYALAEGILQLIATELSDEEIYRFYTDWADLAYNSTETGLLKRIGNELIRLGEERDNPLLIGSGLDNLSHACMTINDFEKGLAYTNQAISQLDKVQPSFELVEAYNHRGTFLYMQNRLEEALISFQDALTISTRVQDPKIHKALSNAHYQTALLQVLFGNPVSAYEHGLKALEFAERIQHTYSIVQAYGIQSLAQSYLGEFAQARQTALKGIELAERMHGWRMLGYLNSYAAIAEVALGFLDDAHNHAETAVQIGEKYEQHDICCLGYRSLGEIYRLLYDYPQAVKYHQKGFAIQPESFLGFDNLYRLGLDQHYQNNPSGLEQIILALNLLEEFSVGVGIFTSKLCLALAFAANQDWPKIKSIADDLEITTQSVGLRSYHISIICLLAEVAIAEGNYDSALDRYRFAAGEAQFSMNPWLEIKAQAGIERVLQLRGEFSPHPGERIEILLEQIKNCTSHPDVRQAYRNFHEQIITRTRIMTDVL